MLTGWSRDLALLLLQLLSCCSIVLGCPSFAAVALLSSFLLLSFPSPYHHWPFPVFQVLAACVYPASIPANCSWRRSVPSLAWGTRGSWIAVSSHWVVSMGVIQVGSSHLAITPLDCYQFGLPSSSLPFLVSSLTSYSVGEE